MARLHAVRVAAHSERGTALVMALLVLVILTAFGLTLIGLSLTEVAIATNWRDYTKDFYAAEAGLEAGVAGLRNLLQGVSSPALVTQAQLDGIAPPSLNTPGTTFTCVPPACSWITSLAPNYQVNFANGPFLGLAGTVFPYQIRARVSGQDGTRADLTQVFQYTQIPLFQFGVFYGQGVDLEIAPGPNMVFNGRVHANSNIYVGAASSLNFNSRITSAGGIYRRIKRDTAYPWGNDPQIMGADGSNHALNFDSQYQPGFSSTWASAAAWAAHATATFGGMVNDGSMGVGQIVPPVPGLFYSTQYDASNPSNPNNADNIAHQLIEMPKGSDSAALTSAKLYSQANVRIVDGTPTGLTCSPPAGAITTKTFYDAREGKILNLTQLDVNLLRTNGCLPNGAVVYVARTGAPTSTTLEAVRLVNGSRLPSEGMSVVSQNPVYILGDYNTTQGSGACSPCPPAAILADAITVLSNNWAGNNSDTKGSQLKSNRPASTTTVNAAFATGPSAESTSNNGNGQLENVIRFLEDWTGDTFNYKGSILALWHSQQATGAWNGNYYTPPTRNWSYDTNFDVNPPPGTPKGVLMTKARWFQS